MPKPVEANSKEYWDTVWGMEEGPRQYPWVYGKWVEMARVFKPESVLDVGCGYSEALATLQQEGRRLVGVDSSMTALRKTKVQWPFIETVEAGIFDIPLPDASFKMVMSNSTLEHLETMAQVYRALDEMWRLTAPGGLMGVCVPRMMYYREHPMVFDWDSVIGMMSQYQASAERQYPVWAFSDAAMSRIVACIQKAGV